MYPVGAPIPPVAPDVLPGVEVVMAKAAAADRPTVTVPPKAVSTDVAVPTDPATPQAVLPVLHVAADVAKAPRAVPPADAKGPTEEVGRVAVVLGAPLVPNQREAAKPAAGQLQVVLVP